MSNQSNLKNNNTSTKGQAQDLEELIGSLGYNNNVNS